MTSIIPEVVSVASSQQSRTTHKKHWFDNEVMASLSTLVHAYKKAGLA